MAPKLNQMHRVQIMQAVIGEHSRDREQGSVEIFHFRIFLQRQLCSRNLSMKTEYHQIPKEKNNNHKYLLAI